MVESFLLLGLLIILTPFLLVLGIVLGFIALGAVILLLEKILGWLGIEL